MPIDKNNEDKKSPLAKAMEALVGKDPVTGLTPYHKPKKRIQWIDGVPVPYTEWVIPKDQMENLFMAAMSLPYQGMTDVLGDIIPEPEYEGMTNIEVAVLKAVEGAARGNLEPLKFVLERVYGKPRQAIDSTNVSISLNQFLSDLSPDLEAKAREWEAKISQAQIIDVKDLKAKDD